jgi:hypothetical protein
LIQRHKTLDLRAQDQQAFAGRLQASKPMVVSTSRFEVGDPPNPLSFMINLSDVIVKAPAQIISAGGRIP